jgi:hypothetical protein
MTSNAYGFGGRTLTVDLIAGYTYTFTVNGKIDSQAKNDGKSLSCYVYENTWTHGSLKLDITSTSNSTVSQQWTPSWTGRYSVSFYLYPSGGSRLGNATVNWAKLEVGNKSTDWTPAPEDTDQKVMDVRNDLRLSAPLPTSLTMNQNGITASTSDPSKYARFDYRGLYVQGGAVEVRRDDGFVTMVGGKLNQSFDLQGSDPPHLVDATVNGRFFQSNITDGNGGTCNLYTFTRVARYVVFQVALMSSSYNQSTAILAQSGNENIWLGSASAFDTNEIVQNIVLDLGVPDGTVYALKLMLKSYSTNNTAYCRKVRAYQTDFPPS